MTKKILKRIALALGVVVLLAQGYTAYWFHTTTSRFSPYVDSRMEETWLSTRWRPDFIHITLDGFNYSVTFPTFPSFQGNLGIAYPSREVTPGNYIASHGLIIWPKSDGNFEFGVILVDEEGLPSYVYIDSEGSPWDSEHQEIIDQYAHVVADLLHRAHLMWGI